MFRKGFVVTTIFGFNILIQLLSQIATTRIFGAKFELDVFLAAVTLPTIIVTIIYGTLNDALMPLYAEKKQEDHKKGEEYLLNILFILTGIGFLKAIFLSLISNPIAWLLYGEKGNLFVTKVSSQMSVMFFSLPLAIFATILGVYFYSQKKFYRFPAAQMLGNLLNLILLFGFYKQLGIWILVIGFLANILLQILIMFNKEVFLFSKNTSIKNVILNSVQDPISLKTKTLLPLLFAWMPLIISNFAIKSDALIIRSFASNLPEGYQVYFNLVYKIFNLGIGVATIAVQIILFPHLIEHITKKNFEKAIDYVKNAKNISLLISAITTILILLVSPFVINLIFVGGKFTAQDAKNTISLLPLFVVPSIGWGISQIYIQPLIAIKKQKELAILNLFSLFLGWGTGYILLKNTSSFTAISMGLIVLLFSSIIGCEILWQKYKKKLLTN